jgi:hypothetical protein
VAGERGTVGAGALHPGPTQGAERVLSVDYQRIVQALADRSRLGQGPLICQERAASFGMDVVPARVEALRWKAKRLVARGWLAESAPGRFTLAKGVGGPRHRQQWVDGGTLHLADSS